MARRAAYQIAALPFRRNAESALEVLLVTSRETRRWVICKGWPMRGKTDWDAAAQEAFEEAGVKGRVHLTSLGAFTYFKRQADSYELLDVVVYPLEVTGQMESFKERGQREAVWTSPIEAAGRVIEPGLKALLLHCEGRLAGKSAA